MNTDKTKFTWIGKKRNSKDEIDVGKPLTCLETTFNLLGVNFSVSLNEMIHINLTPIMKKLEHFFSCVEPKVFNSVRRDNCNKNFCLIKIKSFLFFSTFSWNC